MQNLTVKRLILLEQRVPSEALHINFNKKVHQLSSVFHGLFVTSLTRKMLYRRKSGQDMIHGLSTTKNFRGLLTLTVSVRKRSHMRLFSDESGFISDSYEDFAFSTGR
jgi:hypothetical protein